MQAALFPRPGSPYDANMKRKRVESVGSPHRVADSIRRGLEQAAAYAKEDADPQLYRVHVATAIDMRAICARPRLTQQNSPHATVSVSRKRKRNQRG